MTACRPDVMERSQAWQLTLQPVNSGLSRHEGQVESCTARHGGTARSMEQWCQGLTRLCSACRWWVKLSRVPIRYSDQGMRPRPADSPRDAAPACTAARTASALAELTGPSSAARSLSDMLSVPSAGQLRSCRAWSAEGCVWQPHRGPAAASAAMLPALPSTVIALGGRLAASESGRAALLPGSAAAKPGLGS